MAEKVRVGIIGCGGIANTKHLPALSRTGGVEIVAFCDIVGERAEKAAKEFGAKDAKVYTDYTELLKDKSIQTIHVLTPNKSHAPIAIAAMEAGKHVMCEKPMAKTYVEAKAMCDTATKTGKILTIGYQNRRSANTEYLKQACENGELGEIYFAKAHAVRRRAVPTWGVFLNEDEQGGGPLIDIGTHALDVTLWCMDNYEVKSVMGNTYKKLNGNGNCGNLFGPWKPEEFTVEDSAFGFITMKNGATIILESSWALNTLEVGEAQTTLCGTKAGGDTRHGVRINSDAHGRLNVLTPDVGQGGVAFFEGESDNAEDIECRTFYNAVTKGTPLCVKPEQALVVTQILEAIYESANTGKLIEF